METTVIFPDSAWKINIMNLPSSDCTCFSKVHGKFFTAIVSPFFSICPSETTNFWLRWINKEIVYRLLSLSCQFGASLFCHVLFVLWLPDLYIGFSWRQLSKYNDFLFRRQIQWLQTSSNMTIITEDSSIQENITANEILILLEMWQKFKSVLNYSANGCWLSTIEEWFVTSKQ